MTIELSDNTLLSDPQLLLEVRRLAAHERQATARLIAALGELDARRLYLGEGCSSLFTYCTQVLHLSEHAAYGRIEAARAARKWPAILELLADGSVHLTAISLLAPHLKSENHQQLLALARHKSKRKVGEIVATLRPLPAAASSVRQLPAPKAPLVDRTAMLASPTLTASTPTDPAAVAPSPEIPKPRAAVTPLAPERFKVQFTVSRETYQKLREAQDLLRRRIPNGDVAAIFDRALTLLLAELHRTPACSNPTAADDVQRRLPCSAHSCVREARRVGARRRSVRIRGRSRPVHGAWVSRVSPSRPVRGQRRDER